MRDEELISVIEKHTSEGSKVLEIGSGGGRMAIDVAGRVGCTVYGVDSSRFAVAQARERAAARGLSEKAIFLNQRSESLEFPSGFFDLAYTVKTLHETRATETLREMHRVLRRRGKVVILDWVEGKMTWTRERYFSPEELKEMIKETGFRLSGLEVLDDVMLLTAEK
jgi:ubiquinone/menaquinone biosynthesis C-methylase UbiE